ncbi:hypothetical protein SAY86_025924 [Trapa natans]|uniref:ENT domain-containing protein n=1 Tax=Trapa natans TaxID=22666 RepID=A0AAN7KH15_TRANT|nr:hypothetical protein SAY86_025924 [Trapa natans]
MKLKKGTRVEVLKKEEVSIGAWHAAEIISGNGHNYYVKYSLNLGSNEAKVERVPRKAIRPCPPSVQVFGFWEVGDIAELYHNRSWKTAIIIEVNGTHNYYVRLIGLREELNCHCYQLRVRQIWKDDKWFVLAKGAQSRSTERKLLQGSREKLYALNSFFSTEPNNEVPVPCVPSKERMKRKPHFQAHQMGPQKRRASEKAVSDMQILLNNPLSFTKVDITKKSLGDYNLHSSSRNGRHGLVKMDVGKNDSFYHRSSMTIDADGCTSSVGSCTANGGDMVCGSINHWNRENTDEISDAESSCGKEYQEKVTRNGKENSLARSHSSELHAYSRTIRALFASGPFSWEDETHISNLRQSLHISADEHLTLMMVPKQISWPWSDTYWLFPKALKLWGWISELMYILREKVLKGYC